MEDIKELEGKEWYNNLSKEEKSDLYKELPLFLPKKLDEAAAYNLMKLIHESKIEREIEKEKYKYNMVELNEFLTQLAGLDRMGYRRKIVHLKRFLNKIDAL